MDQLGALFLHNVLPIFLLIALGALLQWRLKLDLRTLNKANLYLFVPALLFNKLLETSIDLGEAGFVAMLAAVSILLNSLTGLWISRRFSATRDSSLAIGLAGSYSNTGNYGIPLMALAFGPTGVAIQTILLMVNNLMIYSVGMFGVAGRGEWRRALTAVLGFPVMYVVIVALALNALAIDLPGPMLTSIGLLGDGLIPVALITLGAQLAETNLHSKLAPIGLAVLMKLVASPIVMAGLVYVSSLIGVIEWGSFAARVLIVNAAIPTAVNTIIVSMEAGKDPAVVAGTVFSSTLASAITVSVVLLLV